jgi:hypothetical protein
MTILKRHHIHIVFSRMLLANIIFSHIALNFFHNHEEGKDAISIAIIKSTTGNNIDFPPILICKKLQEHCKVCDLHLFHELFAEELSILNFLPTIYSVHYNCSETFLGIYSGYSSSRAPPIPYSLS